MKYSDESRERCSRGSLLKKYSFEGRTIIIEGLDVDTANRINERVSRSAVQNRAESQMAMKIADKTYSD